MIAALDYSLYGADLFILKPNKPVRRAREVHTLSAMWQTPSANYFKVGDAPPFAPSMRIILVDEEPEIEGAAYEVRLDCEGILDADKDHIELDYSYQTPEEGWDELRLRVYTATPDDPRWAKGARLMNEAGQVYTNMGNMYITSRSAKAARAKGYWELDLTVKGVLGTKPYKRRLQGAVTSSDVQYASGTETVLTAPLYGGYPPTLLEGEASLSSGLALNVEFEAATLSLTDSWLSATPPPTEYIGTFWTPPSPPDVTIWSLPADGYKWFFPWGWKCTSMPCENLAGTGLWLISSTFVYQTPTIPITTSS